MAYFIELTNSTANKTMLVNIDNVIDFHPAPGKEAPYSFVVKEHLSDILEQIRPSQRA